MRVAILSESSADEAAIRILVGGILGEPTHPISPPSLRSRGWPSVRQVLPTVLKHLHYHTDAEGLILVVDSNHSPVHQSAHDETGGANPQCRLCQLREIVGRVLTHLTPVPNRPPIRTAVGLAVPAIEAWYRCGVDPHVTEAAWVLALQSGSYPYTTTSLKRAVYGTERYSLELETRCATEEAQRLAQNLNALEQMFPGGFGALASEVRNW